jgi:hypothetical protein
MRKRERQRRREIEILVEKYYAVADLQYRVEREKI